MENEEIKTYLSNLKEKNPLIHCITNYVTVNDVANSLIAIGASPCCNQIKAWSFTSS